jgi:hypothetical protein
MILEEALAETVIEGLLLMEIEGRSSLLRSHGIEVRVVGARYERPNCGKVF